MSNATATQPVAQTVELARFATRPAEEAAFLAAHDVAIRAIKVAYPGLLSVFLVRFASSADRTVWADVALWASEEEAMHAATHCPTMPEFMAVVPYMSEDLGVEHGAVVDSF